MKKSKMIEMSEPALHYLYFPNEESAEKAMKEVKQKGFKSEYRLGADGDNWLLLVKHRWPITKIEFNEIEQVLRHIANTYNGEYDGWEIPLN